MIILRSNVVPVEVNDDCVHVYSYKPLETCPISQQTIVTKYAFVVSKTIISRQRNNPQTDATATTHIIFMFEDDVNEMYTDVASFWEKYIENSNTLFVDGA